MDLFADYSSADPAPLLAEAAARECPYQPTPHGVLVFSADAVGELLLDPAFWSARPTDPRLSELPLADRELQQRMRGFLARWPVFCDGEYHDRVRRSLSRGLSGILTPARSAEWDAYADQLLAAAGTASIDWITTIADPLARRVVSTALGQDGTALVEHGRCIIENLATPKLDSARTIAALDAVEALRSWLGAQLRYPASSLLIELAQLWSHDDVGPDGATAALTQVVTGAYDPTVSALGALAEQVTAELLAALPDAPIRNEILRCATPFRFTSRFAKYDTRVGEQDMTTGDRVILCLASANLDHRAFPDPLARRDRGKSTRSFTFGGGTHYCPGAPLARAAVDALLGGFRRHAVVFEPTEVEMAPELPMRRYRKLFGHLRPTE